MGSWDHFGVWSSNVVGGWDFAAHWLGTGGFGISLSFGSSGSGGLGISSSRSGGSSSGITGSFGGGSSIDVAGMWDSVHGSNWVTCVSGMWVIGSAGGGWGGSGDWVTDGLVDHGGHALVGSNWNRNGGWWAVNWCAVCWCAI